MSVKYLYQYIFVCVSVSYRLLKKQYSTVAHLFIFYNHVLEIHMPKLCLHIDLVILDLLKRVNIFCK